MKIFTRIFALALGSVLFLLPVSSASASDFLGTFCWLLEVDGDDEGGEPEFLRLGLSHIGYLHFTLNGILSDGDSIPEEVNLFTGNAEFVGESFVFSLFSTHNVTEDSELQNIGVNATLDAGFNGPFAAVITEAVDGFDPDIFRVTGTLTLSSCPST